MALWVMSTLVVLINATCSHPSEVAPDGLLRVTLKPGESHQVLDNDTVYTIKYKATKINFSEGLGEGSMFYVYMLGDVKLAINGDSVQIRAEGHYDNKGGRQSSSWTHLKDTQGTADVGSLTIGIANFYPVVDAPFLSEGFAIDLLIQQK